MLSSAEPPEPAEEVAWHAANCEAHGSTVVATTRLLSGMTRGRSCIAFYGDAEGYANELLAYGVFAGYGLANTERGRAMLARSRALYGRYGMPKATKGGIELTDFQEAADGAIASLGGVLEGTRTPLSLESLPGSQARIQVYFNRSGDEK
jgi:hypothetical protein